jgi:hypothetical protein
MAKKKELTKKEKALRMFKDHEETFRRLNVLNPVFSPKLFYKNEQGREVAAFFLSEFKPGKDIYVERSTKELEPCDPTRSLYVWKFNPHYAQEYQMSESKLRPGVIRYLIPTEEFFKVSDILEQEENEVGKVPDGFSFDLPDADTDAPFSSMTLRDYACIKLAVPQSHKAWLNEIIKKAK